MSEARFAARYEALRRLAAECADAVEAWDNNLSSWCDGPERDQVRESVLQLRRAINDLMRGAVRSTWERARTVDVLALSEARFVVTEQMVEAGASALAIEEGYNPNLVAPRIWAAVAERYRERARAVLDAALNGDQPE